MTEEEWVVTNRGRFLRMWGANKEDVQHRAARMMDCSPEDVDAMPSIDVAGWVMGPTGRTGLLTQAEYDMLEEAGAKVARLNS